MKKTLFLSLLLGTVLLTWCVRTPSSPEELTELTQTSFDCSTADYYTQFKTEKKISFGRDEEKQAYITTIPELCVKMTLQPKAGTQHDMKQRRKGAEEVYGIEGTLKNNHLVMGKDNNVHYIFRDKNPELSLDETMDNHYGTLAYASSEKFMGKDLCVLEKATEFIKERKNRYADPYLSGLTPEESQYSLLTPMRVSQVALGDVLRANMPYSQICGLQYPAEEEGFWSIQPYDVLYAESYPSRYVMYNLYVTQVSEDSPYINVGLEYIG